MISDDLGKLILRLTLAVLMLFHGFAKAMNPDSIAWMSGALSGYGLPGFVAYGVYVGEIVAPLMILLGVLTRVGAGLIVINMVFAILLAHSGDLFSLTKHGGWALELQGFYLFGALALVFLGSGRFALNPD